MNDLWHERIQRQLNGQSSAEESAALEEALNRDAQLRALYLDYANLDAALGAAAEAAAFPARGARRPAQAPLSRPLWRWLAPAAACAALLLVGLLYERRGAARGRADLNAVTLSARAAISRLPARVPPPIPAWMSPTASLLGEPGYPR
jgi:hypothetical protein